MKTQVSEWLNYYQPTTTDAFGNVPETGEQKPERPEAYDILLQLRRFDCHWADGGYSDQPWLLTQELNACSEAEEDHQNIINLNAQRKAEFENSFKQNLNSLKRPQ